MNTLTPEMHQDSNFSTLYDAIEKRMKENPATSPTETAKDASAPPPKSEVIANNGSTAIGNIQVGGNVTGNIVIGNNNQVNSNNKKK